jgi:hypothetical protein
MATKRKAVNIGTHSGTFHCDEALGCWMLKQTEQFAGDHGLISSQATATHSQPATAQNSHTPCGSSRKAAVDWLRVGFQQHLAWV